MIGQKRKRITQACDFCHRRGLKCKSGLSGEHEYADGSQVQPCLTCTEHGQQCTRRRQPKKRGTKPRIGIQKPYYQRLHGGISHVSDSFVPGSRRIVTILLDVYLDSIHPTFPLFCERELWVGWRDGSFPSDSFDQMSLTCMCALSAQHVSRRALFTDDIDESMSEYLQEDYLAEANHLISMDFDTGDLNLIRSYALLALLGAQKGSNAMLHKYLGLYHGLCAQMNLQDETQWPLDITECEKEVRRRLWWAMYRLEVHTACVLGNLVRSSESQCNVGYPRGTHHPAFIPGRNGEFEDWFAGWNTTTDLYRVLEHVISDFRSKNRPTHSVLGCFQDVRSDLIMERLSKLQEDLLPQFGTVSSRSDDSGRNRCGFQAANILCTIHLARLLSCISGDRNIQNACQNAHDMVQSMKTIPFEYFRAIGSPLIQQLAGVGHILISVARKHRVVRDQYLGVRNAVLSIIELLERLHRQNMVETANIERLTTQLGELDKSRETAEESQTTSGCYDWTSYTDVEFLENSRKDDFPSQLLTNFTWPYLDS